MWWHTTETVFDIFKLSILLFIFTLNLKSECIRVLDLSPKPSDPNNNIFFPFQLFEVKSLVAETSKALIQKFLVFKYFNELMLAGTLAGVEMGLMKSKIPYKKGGILKALEYLS